MKQKYIYLYKFTHKLLEIFGQYAQVKDIRMISDKISCEPKDFAFVEYYTIDEATIALNQIKRNPIKIRNNQIYVTFSKIRRPEDLKVINAFNIFILIFLYRT